MPDDEDAAVGLPAPPAAAAAKLFNMMLPLGSGATVDAEGVVVVVAGGGGGGGGFIGAHTTCCRRGASAIFSVGPRGKVLAVCTS